MDYYPKKRGKSASDGVKIYRNKCNRHIVFQKKAAKVCLYCHTEQVSDQDARRMQTISS